MDRRIRKIERDLAALTEPARDASPLVQAAVYLAADLDADPGCLSGLMIVLAGGDRDIEEAAQVDRIAAFLRSWLAGEETDDPELAGRLESHNADHRAQKARHRAWQVTSAINGTARYFRHGFDPLRPCAGLSLEQCVTLVGDINGWQPDERDKLLANVRAAKRKVA